MKQYVVDAFTDKVFHGNQAAVCVPDRHLSDELMMNITRENNFSETAFAVKAKEGYELRWFTPGGEIDLCGHATLATAYVLFRFYEPDAQRLTFHSMSGDLFVEKSDAYLIMDFPAYQCKEVPVTEEMTAVLGAAPTSAFMDRDLLLVYEDEKTVRALTPNFEAMKRLGSVGVTVTAPGNDYDCVSRFFAPKLKINEDPVTGSAHCMIAPYWSKRLGKSCINAYQASERGGELRCETDGNRVKLAGKAVLASVDELNL